jgi:hypothetical protein
MMERWDNGMLEYWNNESLRKLPSFPPFISVPQYSIIPSFHHSNFPSFPFPSGAKAYFSEIAGGGLIRKASGALGAPLAKTRCPWISSLPSAYIWMAWE